MEADTAARSTETRYLTSPEGRIAYDQFFVPGILAYGVITSSFVNLGISTVSGVVMGTFVPPGGKASRMVSASIGSITRSPAMVVSRL